MHIDMVRAVHGCITQILALTGHLLLILVDQKQFIDQTLHHQGICNVSTNMSDTDNCNFTCFHLQTSFQVIYLKQLFTDQNRWPLSTMTFGKMT